MIRGHGNFAEYVPNSLLLLGFAEIGGTEPAVIYLGGTLLIVGLLLHAYAMAMTEKNHFARRYGMIMTMASIVIGIGACLRLSLGSERLQTNRVHPCAILPFVLNHNETAVFGPTIIKAVSEDRTWTPRYSTNPAYPAGT